MPNTTLTRRSALAAGLGGGAALAMPAIRPAW